MRHAFVPVLLALAVGASDGAHAGAPKKPPPGPETKAVVDGANEFAFELYAKLAANGKGNLFFSPLSVHAAMAMAYAGAAGETAAQIAKTMHCPEGGTELAEAYGEVLRRLRTPGQTYGDQPVYELSISNRLWSSKRFRIRPAFSELLTKAYGAEVKGLDFGRAREASRTINDVVARETDGKIADLVSPDTTWPLTALVLTNAVYFRSRWDHRFSKTDTKEEPFQVSEKRSVKCQMMHRAGTYVYFEDDDVQLLVMPYKYYELYMMVVLPTKMDGLGAVERTISSGKVADWLRSAAAERVNVAFPRFKVTGGFPLSDTLKNMGMAGGFVLGQADFSGMVAGKSPFIAEIIHRSFVALDEEGTEAAAVTAVRPRFGAMKAKPGEPKEFKADHPFIFLIRHSATGAILFAGRLMSPSP